MLNSGSHHDSLIVDGTEILDLEIESKSTQAPGPSKPVNPLSDPAIISYQRPVEQNSAKGSTFSQNSFRPSPLTDYSSQVALQDPPSAASLQPKPRISVRTKSWETLNQASPSQKISATLSRPFNDLSLHSAPPVPNRSGFTNLHENSHQKPRVSPSHDGFSSSQLHVRKPEESNRRNFRKEKAKTNKESKHLSISSQQDVSNVATPGQKTARKANGWRETPLIEHVPASGLLQPIDKSTHSEKRLKKIRRGRRRPRKSDAPNGWATEDASDIQDLGDFDFQGNLSKFDKHGIFDQIRQEDTTADEERLITYNRRPARAGTSGGKNLHYTENVLDSPKPNGKLGWNSEDSEQEQGGSMNGRGRSLHKIASRSSLKKSASRKGSIIMKMEQHSSSPGSQSEPVIRTDYSLHEQAKAIQHIPTPSIPRPSKLDVHSKSSLRIVMSQKVCPCITPLQMIELEQLAISELALTEEIITENAGRQIAETARKMAVSVLVSRHQPPMASKSSLPLIVILAGNHRSGARALAAGRHLQNHATRVVVCILGLDRREELLDSVQHQLSIYRNCRGSVAAPVELTKDLSHFPQPPSLIIDSLLGIHISFDDLRTDDQAAYFSLVSWANNGDSRVLAVDIPSGLDASSGIIGSLSLMC